MAWESDRVAFRIYGAGLKKTSSAMSSDGIDVWNKKTRAQIGEKWTRRGTTPITSIPAKAPILARAFSNSVPNNHASVRDRSLPLNRTGIRVALEVQERVLGP